MWHFHGKKVDRLFRLGWARVKAKEAGPNIPSPWLFQGQEEEPTLKYRAWGMTSVKTDARHVSVLNGHALVFQNIHHTVGQNLWLLLKGDGSPGRPHNRHPVVRRLV